MASLPKSVAFLPRYATVSAAANHRYLDALAVVDDPAPAQTRLVAGGFGSVACDLTGQGFTAHLTAVCLAVP